VARIQHDVAGAPKLGRNIEGRGRVAGQGKGSPESSRSLLSFSMCQPRPSSRASGRTANYSETSSGRGLSANARLIRVVNVNHSGLIRNNAPGFPWTLRTKRLCATKSGALFQLAMRKKSASFSISCGELIEVAFFERTEMRSESWLIIARYECRGDMRVTPPRKLLAVR